MAHTEKTLFLIDGSSFLYRSYYSLRPLHAPSGEPVQAVYGFCRMIKKLIDSFNPSYIALVWDSKGKTVRHEIYPAYKETRQSPPSDLFEQKRRIQVFADAIGLRQIAQQGVEADDLLYSMAQDAAAHGHAVVIISSDKDMGQVLNERIRLFDPVKNNFITTADFEKEYGFKPSQLPFYFALVGDASDNIPGVNGIGKKTALELVQQFGTLEHLYEHLEHVTKPRIRALLAEGKDNAFLSNELFLLRYEKVPVSLEECLFDPARWADARSFFEELAFTSLLKPLETVKEPMPVTSFSSRYGYHFITVITYTQLTDLVALIKEQGRCALDTESDAVGPFFGTLIGISVCCTVGQAYYIPFGHRMSDESLQADQLSRETVLTALRPVLEDVTIKKIFHNAKYDLLVFYNAGISVRGTAFDTMIAASLVTQEWESAGLKALSGLFFNEVMLTYQQVVKERKLKNFAYVSLADATEYSAADAHQTLKLVPVLQEKLQQEGMHTLYETIEFPLMTVLYAMERFGIACDVQVLAILDKQVTHDLGVLRNDIISLVGDAYADINLNSPKQLEELLFTHLQLTPIKKSDKRTGYSTDHAVLQELARHHPVPALIMRYRELYKLKSTYIDALPTYISPKTGKIHTSFNQISVATGRLASTDPNLQNIPVDNVWYRTQIRAAFKPDPGFVFIAADYSQIELRVLAYLSQDQTLRDAFAHNHDIHALTAAGIFGVPLAQVSNEQRKVGKRINFSILYGLTPFGLSKDLGISLTEAKRYIERYFAQYPQVSLWMESVIEETKKYGYVTTHWGRRRAVPGIYEHNKILYELARRIAINTKAQGTAAEIMKIGMINVDRAFQAASLNAHMVLQIHDELLVAAALDKQQEVMQLMQHTLETVVDWNVPLQVSIRTGETWQAVTK